MPHRPRVPKREGIPERSLYCRSSHVVLRPLPLCPVCTQYYCKKAGNADKPLCAQPITPTSVKPKFVEMRDAFKSYCADAANQKDIKACNGAKSTFGFPSASPQVKAMMQTTAKAPKAPKAAAAKPAGAAKAAKKASKAKAKPDTSS
jgi:hypothetical protein